MTGRRIADYCETAAELASFSLSDRLHPGTFPLLTFNPIRQVTRTATGLDCIMPQRSLSGAGASVSPSVCQDGLAPRSRGRRTRSGESARPGGGETARTLEADDTAQTMRFVAVCSIAGADLNAWMVEQRWAVAYRKYSTHYVSHETAAKAVRP